MDIIYPYRPLKKYCRTQSGVINALQPDIHHNAVGDDLQHSQHYLGKAEPDHFRQEDRNDIESVSEESIADPALVRIERVTVRRLFFSAHNDVGHAYQNERSVGEAVRESGIPREEIWITSKLWPSEYGEGKTAEAIDKMLGRSGTEYIDLLLLHQQFGDYIGA